jgi:uncharacterized repeat protein (TIGR03803 family)
MKGKNLTIIAVSFLAVVTGFCLSAGTALATGGHDFVLYSFQGGTDGNSPYAGLTADKFGNLYGTTSGFGVSSGNVFKLSPPTTLGGVWTETVLYGFTAPNDGGEPIGGVIFDAAGNLYGTTKFGGTGGPTCQYGGGGCGTVFMVSPPPSGGAPWNETILYNFQNSTDGELPQNSLVMDAAGNLYGTTYLGGNQTCACGTVFELSPPALSGGAWTETTLYSFNGYLGGQDGQGPAALTFDPKGNLWGTAGGGGTQNSGTIFRLLHTASGKWVYKTMYNFTPWDAGIDPNALTYYKGSFFGTASYGGDYGNGDGTVFELSPPAVKGGAWTETTLFVFKFGPEQSNPVGTLAVDAAGNLYGATSGYDDPGMFGTVFKMAPPAVKGGAWTFSNMYVFKEGPDAEQPRSGVIFGKFGALYGTTLYGGTGTIGTGSAGTVFAVLP